jgi:hypothetical protein
MITLSILMNLLCSEPKMQNVSRYPWNAFDRSTLRQAKKRCGELYPDDPCVKLFRKYEKLSYSVICGKGSK